MPPPGVFTSTVSPFFLPIRARAVGEVIDHLVGGRAGVEDDRLAGPASLLDPGDELAFVVALRATQRNAMCTGENVESSLDLGERLGAVGVGLARSQQVQVGSVQDMDDRHGGVRDGRRC